MNAITADIRSIPATGRGTIAGHILSGIAIVALTADAVFKIAAPQLMIANSPPLGLAPDPGLYRLIGAILLAGIALHLWRRTAFLGALLITAFLGGAVAVNLRADMPLLSNTLFGAYVGIVLWVGFWLRDARVRALVQ